MLFGIYLGTTIYAWRTMFKYIRDFKEKLDEEGYELVNKKFSIFEYIGAAIMVSLPVVNLIYPFFFGDVNRTYNEIKLKMIKEGSICLKESELNNLEEMPKTKEEIMEEVVRLREEVNALRNERKQDRVVTANMDIETLRKKALNLQKLAHAVANKEGAFGGLLNDEERKDILRKISKIINEMVRRAQEAVKDTDIEENNFEERLYPLMNQTFTSNDEQYFPEQKTYRK